MKPVHPALAAAWIETFVDQKALELQNIEGVEVDDQLAKDYVRYVTKSFEQLLKDIERG